MHNYVSTSIFTGEVKSKYCLLSNVSWSDEY